MVEKSQQKSREPQEQEIFLIDRHKKTAIPLLRTAFNVNISYGYADMELNQVYENSNDHPLETLFMMPYSESFTLNKIIIMYILADGTQKRLETKVSEREAAFAKYHDAVSQGETVLISYTESRSESKSMLRIKLGNFPPNSKAHLRAICSQKLDFEDLSYCFRIPMAFVPSYMGNI